MNTKRHGKPAIPDLVRDTTRRLTDKSGIAMTKQRRQHGLRQLLGTLALTLAMQPLWAGDDEPGMDDLTHLSLEELMNIEVTSVAKKPQRRADVAAALFVISAEDLRRWGVNNIPDALRMVPGLHVARLDANKWAITSRGFNGRFANKLLVMIDGRSVYTPLFAGVYWDTQQVPIENIARIEVVRGPGGSVWGANAVNGVINIITRDASDTQGNLVSVSAGDELRGATTLRHGGKLGSVGHYRVHGRFVSYDTGYNQDDPHDDWEAGQLGFRGEWSQGRNQFTLQGDYQSGKAGQQVTIPTDPAPATMNVVDDTDLDNSNLLFRWQHRHSGGNTSSLQVYYDHVGYDGAVLYEDRDTVDVEFQNRFRAGTRHDMTWGLGYRHISEDTNPTSSFELIPDNRDVNLYSTFLQDEISLIRNRLALTIGSKFEHNDFSGYEVQPSARLAWTPDMRQTWWGAVSRAVRTPARGEHDVRLRVVPPSPAPPAPVLVTGNDDFDSEELIALEAGYRLTSQYGWSMDTTAFYNSYDRLRTFDPVVTDPSEITLPFNNQMDGHSWGIELAANWEATDNWRLQAAWSWLRVQLDLQSGSNSPSEQEEDSSPTQQWSLWSSLDLPHQTEWDVEFRYVGSVDYPATGTSSYLAVDSRLGWHVSDALELSVTGRNLFDRHHPENLPDFIQSQPTEVERSVEASAVWRF